MSVHGIFVDNRFYLFTFLGSHSIKGNEPKKEKVYQFSCPYCSKIILSPKYDSLALFEKSVKEHMKKEHILNRFVIEIPNCVDCGHNVNCLGISHCIWIKHNELLRDSFFEGYPGLILRKLNQEEGVI